MGPHPNLWPVSPPVGETEPYDQVPRLLKFRAEHPEWTVGYVHDIGVWQALKLTESGSHTIVRYVLRRLLDELGAEYL